MRCGNKHIQIIGITIIINNEEKYKKYLVQFPFLIEKRTVEKYC